MALTKAKASNILLTTPAASSNDTTPATTQYVTTAVANLIDSAPANLNTLNELAAAMADNASFFSTVLPLSGGTMTGALTGTSAAFNSGATNIVATFTSTDGLGGIQLADDTGNVELVANGNNFEVRNAGGAVKMVVENGGNVGIGATSPARKLSVNSAGVQIAASFTSTSSNSARIGLVDANTTGDNYVNVAASGDAMALYAGANERMRITSGGYVGILQSGSTVSHPLHITKEIAGYQAYFNNDNGSAQGVKVRIKSNDSGNFNMLELVSASTGSDVTAMVVRDDGNVGIGDAASSFTNAALHVAKDMGSSVTAVARLRGRNTTARTTRLQFEDYGGAIADGLIDFHFPNAGSHTGAYFGMGYNAGNQLAINSSGYVGIGTTTPSTKLHIASGAVAANDLTMLTLENGNSTGDLSTPDTFIDFKFTDSNSNVTPQARIAGHAGDGGDANTQALEGKGYLTFHTSDTTATSGVVAPPERMRIDNVGRVTMPYQPSFKIGWATRNATGSNRILSGNEGDSQYTGRDTHNTGNHFNVTTGRFTAPVAGTYLLGFAGMRNGTNGSYLECRWKKNGSLMWGRAYKGAFDQSHEYWVIVTITKAAVGDYFQVMIDGNTSIYYDDTYSYGHLMG